MPLHLTESARELPKYHLSLCSDFLQIQLTVADIVLSRPLFYMPAHPPLSTWANATVASSGTCHIAIIKLTGHTLYNVPVHLACRPFLFGPWSTWCSLGLQTSIFELSWPTRNNWEPCFRLIVNLIKSIPHWWSIVLRFVKHYFMH